MKKKMIVVGTILSATFLLLTGCGKKGAEVVDVQEESGEKKIITETAETEETAEMEAEPSDLADEEIKDFSGYKYIFDFNGENLFGFNIPEEYAVGMHEKQSIEGYSMHNFGLYERGLGSLDLQILTGYELNGNSELVNEYSETVQAEKQEEMETDLGVAEFYFTTVEDSYSAIDYETLEVVEGVYDKHEEVALLDIDGVTVTFWWSTYDDDHRRTVEEYTGRLRELLPLLLMEETDKELLTDNWDDIGDNHVEVDEKWNHVIYAEEEGACVAVIGINDVEGWEYMDSRTVGYENASYALGGGCNTTDFQKSFNIFTAQVENTDKYNFYFGKGVSSLEEYKTLQETNKIGEIDSPFGKILIYKSIVQYSGGEVVEEQFGIIRNNGINIWIDYGSSKDTLADILPAFFE